MGKVKNYDGVVTAIKDIKRDISFPTHAFIEDGDLYVPFVYTSNGDSFFEHDFTTGLEKEFPLSEFPTADELYTRWKGVDAQKIIEVENRERYYIDGKSSA